MAFDARPGRFCPSHHRFANARRVSVLRNQRSIKVDSGAAATTCRTSSTSTIAPPARPHENGHLAGGGMKPSRAAGTTMWPGQAVYPSRTLRIEPAASWQGLNAAELWRYRELLYFFVWRDIKVRYKQTVLGALWAIIQPVAATLLFTVFFGRLAACRSRSTASVCAVRVSSGCRSGRSYAIAVSLAANSLVGSSHLIAKIYFPRLLIPIAAICPASSTLPSLRAFSLVLMVVYHVPPSRDDPGCRSSCSAPWSWPPERASLFSALIVSYRDFRYVITFVVQLWLFATPVLYTSTSSRRSGGLSTRSIRWWHGRRLSRAVLGGRCPLDVILSRPLSARRAARRRAALLHGASNAGLRMSSECHRDRSRA